MRWLILTAAVIGLGLLTVACYQLSRPTVLRIAVGPQGLDDAELVATLARSLADARSSVRLTVVPTSGPVQSMDELAKGSVHLAVARADRMTSDRARAVAILHTDPVAIVALDTTTPVDLRSLRSKTLGVLDPPGADDALLAALRQHFRIGAETRFLSSSRTEVAAAIRERKVDALLFVVPTSRTAKLAESWAAIRNASRRRLAFVSIDGAEAIAAASPVYEVGEIPSGQFGSSPPLPKENVNTLQVSTYLVADRDVSSSAISQLTRGLFEARTQMASDAPAASLVRAVSVDRDTALPIHPGAKAYFDGEEETALERYADWLYFIPLIIGGLGSAFLALLRLLGFRGGAEELPILSGADDVIGAIDRAGTAAELDAIRARIDQAVGQLAGGIMRGELDQSRISGISFLVSHLDALIAERRRQLARRGQLAEAAE